MLKLYQESLMFFRIKLKPEFYNVVFTTLENSEINFWILLNSKISKVQGVKDEQFNTGFSNVQSPPPILKFLMFLRTLCSKVLRKSLMFW